jgi:hypothetical protein
MTNYAIDAEALYDFVSEASQYVLARATSSSLRLEAVDWSKLRGRWEKCRQSIEVFPPALAPRAGTIGLIGIKLEKCDARSVANWINCAMQALFASTSGKVFLILNSAILQAIVEKRQVSLVSENEFDQIARLPERVVSNTAVNANASLASGKSNNGALVAGGDTFPDSPNFLEVRNLRAQLNKFGYRLEEVDTSAKRGASRVAISLFLLTVFVCVLDYYFVTSIAGINEMVLPLEQKERAAESLRQLPSVGLPGLSNEKSAPSAPASKVAAPSAVDGFGYPESTIREATDTGPTQRGGLDMLGTNTSPGAANIDYMLNEIRELRTACGNRCPPTVVLHIDNLEKELRRTSERKQ